MNKQKQLSINLLSSILAFIINMGINFFITPYITKNIGIEAYGFVSLGTNFINYASLVTIALNSMAGRYITIEIHRDNWKDANKYFNSVLLANCIIVGVMLIPSILCVVYIDKIVNVPKEILSDVRVLFSFLFANYLISVLISSFAVATFATNKLYLRSLREIESRIINITILILMFIFLKPAVSYLGISAFVALIYIVFFNIYYTKKFLPKIIIQKSYFDSKAVNELISSGIWNTVIQVGQILLQGVDLLIANLFVSATAMGALALSKTIPIAILSLVGVIAATFMPDFTKHFANNDIKELLLSIKRSVKLLGVIVIIPVSILLVFGKEFFVLWVPDQNPKELQILSIIAIISIVISGPINSIYGVFTVTNKLKTNAVVLLTTGILNIVVVLVILKTTDMGIYAIAGISTILGIIRNLVFTAPFGARYLGLKWYTFFPEILKGIIAFLVVSLIGSFINYFIEVNSWVKLIVISILTSGVGLIINIFIFLSKSERNYLKLIFVSKFSSR